jgi:alanine-glyoxylate transaminase/serine-glyoxylate transaminase/serine-pyruvate transaminase
MGVEFAVPEGQQLPTLNAVRIPDGVDDAAVRKQLLQQFGIEIGGGLGALKGKTWRIGLMGEASRENNVLLFLAALERCLAEQGVNVEPGAGVGAANETLARE